MKQTLTERIDNAVEGYSASNDADDLKRAIKEIVERTTNPDSFCPECDDRMFWQKQNAFFRCINCGYEDKQKMIVVDSARVEAKEDEPVAKPKTTSRGNKIRELAASLGSGGGSGSLRDPKMKNELEAQIKKSSGLSGQVNWS